MVLDNFANLVRQGLGGSVASGDITISVTDASAFPDPSTANYNIIIWDGSGRPDQDPDAEFVRVTGRDTTNDTLTVTRGQEGTTATSHPSSGAVADPLTAKTITDIDTALGKTVGQNYEHVYDTTGRYLGQLTGTSDASVISDAITDRTGNSAVVVPDPGFTLEWDQVVTLPDEDQFTIDFRGNPTITTSSGFSDGWLIQHPSGTSVTRQAILGPVKFQSINNIGQGAIDFTDVSDSLIRDIKLFGSDGSDAQVKFAGGSNGTADNKAQNVTALVETDGLVGFKVDGSSTYSNDHVFEDCFFDRGGGGTGTGWLVDGATDAENIQFVRPRAEHAETIFDLRDAEGYYIQNNELDRVGEYSYTIKESGRSFGTILIGQADTDQIFDKARITSWRTNITGHAGAGYKRLAPTDLLEDMRQLRRCQTISELGYRDNSTNGSVIVKEWAGRGQIQLSTGSASGETAVLDMGIPFIDSSLHPVKFLFELFPNATGGASDDDDDVVVRVGCWNDSNNLCEIVYDPTNHLGKGFGNGNWWFWLRTGGTDRATTDTGIAPTNSNQYVGVQRLTNSTETFGDSNPRWEGAIGDSGTASTTVKSTNGGTDVGTVTPRIYVETRTSAAKQWNHDVTLGQRCWL